MGKYDQPATSSRSAEQRLQSEKAPASAQYGQGMLAVQCRETRLQEGATQQRSRLANEAVEIREAVARRIAGEDDIAG